MSQHDLGVILIILGAVQIFMAWAWRGVEMWPADWSDDDLEGVLRKTSDKSVAPGSIIPLTNAEFQAYRAWHREQVTTR